MPGLSLTSIVSDMSPRRALPFARRVIAYGKPSDVLNADRLLEAFGIALRGIHHEGHEDLLAPEHPHAH